MKRFLLLFSIGIFVILLICMIAPISEAKGIYEGVVRIHILAESDSEEDQQLKLAVRDAILEYSSAQMKQLSSVEQAREYIENNMDSFVSTAEEVIKKSGYDYDVTAEFCVEYYPTRQYLDVTMPAGEYLSLRINIGSGQGKNWWCMVYPPLCTSAAKAEEELIQAGFSSNQIRLITQDDDEEYEMKFKFIESAQQAVEKIKGLFS